MVAQCALKPDCSRPETTVEPDQSIKRHPGSHWALPGALWTFLAPVFAFWRALSRTPTPRHCATARAAARRCAEPRLRRSWLRCAGRYVDGALYLAEARAAGKVRHIGVTNFDTPRVEAMVKAGVPIAANQVGGRRRRRHLPALVPDNVRYVMHAP
jgi:hypothetical protein